MGRFARRGEDRAVVVPEEIKPTLDLLGVPELALYTKVSAEERRPELGYQLLGRVGFCPEPPREVTVQARVCTENLIRR